MKSRFVSEFSTDTVYAKDLVQLLISLLKAKDNSEVQDLCSSCIRYAGGNLYINIDGLDRPIYINNQNSSKVGHTLILIVHIRRTQKEVQKPFLQSRVKRIIY